MIASLPPLAPFLSPPLRAIPTRYTAVMRVGLFVLALLGLLGLSSAQLPFSQITPSTDMWNPRTAAAVELVKQTRTFYDGVQGGRSTQLSNYFVSTHNNHNNTSEQYYSSKQPQRGPIPSQLQNACRLCRSLPDEP